MTANPPTTTIGTPHRLIIRTTSSLFCIPILHSNRPRLEVSTHKPCVPRRIAAQNLPRVLLQRLKRRHPLPRRHSLRQLSPVSVPTRQLFHQIIHIAPNYTIPPSP